MDARAASVVSRTSPRGGETVGMPAVTHATFAFSTTDGIECTDLTDPDLGAPVVEGVLWAVAEKLGVVPTLRTALNSPLGESFTFVLFGVVDGLYSVIVCSTTGF